MDTIWTSTRAEPFGPCKPAQIVPGGPAREPARPAHRPGPSRPAEGARRATGWAGSPFPDLGPARPGPCHQDGPARAARPKRAGLGPARPKLHLYFQFIIFSELPICNLLCLKSVVVFSFLL